MQAMFLMLFATLIPLNSWVEGTKMTISIERIRESVIGERILFNTPFGDKPMVYADYTASGRALSFIEETVQDHVLPFYANTHTETSFSGKQTGKYREQARA